MKSSLLKAIQVLGKKDRITVLGAGLASPPPLGSGERWANRRCDCDCDCDCYRLDTLGSGIGVRVTERGCQPTHM